MTSIIGPPTEKQTTRQLMYSAVQSNDLDARKELAKRALAGDAHAREIVKHLPRKTK